MNTSLTRNHDMERIYMNLLQEAETSVYYLHNKLDRTTRRISRLRAPAKKISEPSKPHFSNYFEFDSTSGINFILLLSVSISSYILFRAIDFLFKEVAFINTVSRISMILAIIAGFVNIRSAMSKYEKAKKEYTEKLTTVRNTNHKNIQQAKTDYATASRLVDNKHEIEAEYKKALELRDDLYNVNWIPNQYRDIRVIYYICDMVLSSNIGIEEALKYYLLQEANNKLDAVLQKMDTIIENQNEIIVNQAVMNAQNEKLIQQNTSIISHAQQIEENTRLSAEYSQIGARYAEANAYFSLATYLKIE